MDEVLPPGAPRRARKGADWPVALAHVITPIAVAAAFTVILTGWSWPFFGAVLPLLAIGLRPAVWGVAASLRSNDEPRRRAYLSRRKAVASPSLVIMAILGLSFMDVFRLPGAPHWTNQPDAGLSLAAVAVYLVWLSSHANIPAEIRTGWRAALGPRRSD